MDIDLVALNYIKKKSWDVIYFSAHSKILPDMNSRINHFSA
jgi:hypothetical protein